MASTVFQKKMYAFLYAVRIFFFRKRFVATIRDIEDALSEVQMKLRGTEAFEEVTDENIQTFGGEMVEVGVTRFLSRLIGHAVSLFSAACLLFLEVGFKILLF